MKLEIALGPDLAGPFDLTRVRHLVLTAAGDGPLSDHMDEIRENAPLLEELEIIGFRVTVPVARSVVRFRGLRRITFTECVVDGEAHDILDGRPEPSAHDEAAGRS